MITTSNASPYTYLLDEEWIVAIEEEIETQPENFSKVIEPELMGRYDAEMGNPCNPTKYYAKLGEVEAYKVGYETAKAVLDELVQDYVDDMLDREFWARGWW